MHLAGMRLLNFCGYKDTKFNFLNDEGKPHQVLVIFGPNGMGKTSLLDAIKLVSNPYLYANKDCSLQFRKLVNNEDYDPTYDFVKNAKNSITTSNYNEDAGENDEAGPDSYDFEDIVNIEDETVMEIEGAFSTEDGFNTVILNNSGLSRCDLPKKSKGYTYWIDADHPSHLYKFQIAKESAELFLEIAEVVYGFPCKFNSNPIKESFPDKNGDRVLVEIYTDFIIDKHGAKVHYKRMSAGEKKIATLLSYLCDKSYMEDMDIVLIDNIELHVYYQRHAAMLDKILQCFPNKQFIFTSHSGTLIEHIRDVYGEACLLDLERIKGE